MIEFIYFFRQWAVPGLQKTKEAIWMAFLLRGRTALTVCQHYFIQKKILISLFQGALHSFNICQTVYSDVFCIYKMCFLMVLLSFRWSSEESIWARRFFTKDTPKAETPTSASSPRTDQRSEMTSILLLVFCIKLSTSLPLCQFCLFKGSSKNKIDIIFLFVLLEHLFHECYDTNIRTLSPVDDFRAGVLHLLSGLRSSLRHVGHRGHKLHHRQGYVTHTCILLTQIWVIYLCSTFRQNVPVVICICIAVFLAYTLKH